MVRAIRKVMLRIAMAVAAITLTLACAELIARYFDRLPLLTARLPVAATIGAPASSLRDAAADRYLPKIPVANGVDPAWYRHDPPPRPEIQMTAAFAQRYKKYAAVDPYGAFFAWNREFLQHEICAHSTIGSMGVLDDFYVFDPPTPTWYPTFRHLSNIRPPQWFPTNRFGWRGPDLAFNKPAQTIRIAFVGSSMTVDPYYLPFSHIEYIGEWLNQWMQARGLSYRVEVINAARTGIDPMSVTAIVEQEVSPLEPDLVVYDGANDFGPLLQLDLAGQRLSAPSIRKRTPSRLDLYSAVARRIHALLNRIEHRDGSEPPKPPVVIQWPAGVNEQHPDVTQPSLPMNLFAVLERFEAMRTATESTGGQFALSSPVRMVRDGLKLTLPEDQTLFDFLYKTYYPLTYAQVQRLSDFHRRVYRAYAERRHLLYLDSAALYPLEPILFGDVVHMTPAGLRLKAWIDLQLLIPWLDKEIESGRLPRPMQHPKAVHPGFASVSYPLVSKAEILAGCH